MLSIFFLKAIFDGIKEKKFTMLFATFVSGIFSILTSIIIFPPMISHIFGGANSTHSLSSFSSADPFVEKVSKLFIGLYKAFFGPGIIVYLVLIIIGYLWQSNYDITIVRESNGTMDIL